MLLSVASISLIAGTCYCQDTGNKMSFVINYRFTTQRRRGVSILIICQTLQRWAKLTTEAELVQYYRVMWFVAVGGRLGVGYSCQR